MKETEITVQVFNNLDEVYDILEKQKFKIVEHYILNDYYFSKFNNEQLNSLTYSEIIANSFLVREVITENEKKSQLCYKNKFIDDKGNVLAEEKVRTRVQNMEDTLKIFDLAGINCWCSLNQNMICYKKEGIEILIQIVEGLGVFIEYEEDKSMAGMSEQQKIEFMFNNLKSIGLKLGEDYSCKKVYMKFLEEQNGVVQKSI